MAVSKGSSTIRDSSARPTRSDSSSVASDTRSEILNQVRALKEAAQTEKQSSELRFKVLIGTREIERLMELT